MAAIFFDERKDETVIVVEVETSMTVEGQTNTQTATVRQGTQGPKGTSYSEENCHILMYNEDPNLDPYNRTIRLQVGNSPALAQKLYIVVVERNSEKSLVIIGSDSCPKKHRTVGWGGRRAGKAPQACLAEDPVPEAYARDSLALLL